MTVYQQLERGVLRCPCSRKAVRIVARHGVCRRCLRWEQNMETVRPGNPDAKYAEKFFMPDYGRKTGVPNP